MNTEGHVWTQQRRVSLTKLRDLGFGRKSLDLSMVQEVDYVIDKLLEHSGSSVKINSTFNAAIINVLWQIVASKRFEPDHPDTERMMAMLNAQFKAGIRPVFFVPHFLGKYVPLQDVDHYLLEMKSMMRKLISEHKESIDHENPRDFIDVYLTEMKSNPSLDEEHLAVICVDFFQAGSETTSTTLNWVSVQFCLRRLKHLITYIYHHINFFHHHFQAVLFMTLNPEVQKKVQAEIHSNIGPRSPTMDDVHSLPYVMATIMEIQRLGVIAPGSLIHILLKDQQFNGYYFEKGTSFVSNLTKFLMDPMVFDSPHTLNPDRFLDENMKIRKYEQFVPFGIGKRICMGDSLAKNEMFLFFVRIMQRVTFEATHNVPSIQNVTTGITRIPHPFEVKVKST